MHSLLCLLSSSFFFSDTATPAIYTLSLHDALPISPARRALGAGGGARRSAAATAWPRLEDADVVSDAVRVRLGTHRSEEHTLNSSHVKISYAVFCLKKKKNKNKNKEQPPTKTRKIM